MAELHVSKKTIGKLFSEMQNKKFVIPDYQRPYKWDIEKCETLWNDIEHFFQTEARTEADYFLGTIVSYVNGGKNPEIIDGQQRITSFLLLLRAFYKKLEGMAEDAQVTGLKNQIAPCIWDVDRISQVVNDKTKIHIVSEVATAEDNETFHKILETGDTGASDRDNYSENYRFFQGKCDRYATDNPMQWKEFCVSILNQCIILPIECDAQDTALTIFSTLNNRGMPLADSDIFKAQIYRNCETEEKRKAFTETWKELTQICKDGGFSIDDIFRYHTHVLRARAKDRSTTEVGLRKFYAENEYRHLRKEGIMAEIMDLAFFWRFMNTGSEPDNDEYNYSISGKARIHLHCLSCYPNDYWKNPTNVFFMKNRASETFENDFEALLQKLVAYLFAKYIDSPTSHAIKTDIYGACVALNENKGFPHRFVLDEEALGHQIEHASTKISKALLLLYAYLHPGQTEPIPADKLEIEHILPKKWQDANYNGWSKDEADAYLDRFGNKTVCEKKLNIQAGNGYFGVKKQKYKQSNIAAVRELSDHPKNDWGKEDIEQREADFKTTLLSFFRANLPSNN